MSEHVLLGSEVAEEGSGRHLARPGDVLDGHALEAPLGELAQRGTDERLPRLLLLALAEPEAGHR